MPKRRQYSIRTKPGLQCPNKEGTVKVKRRQWIVSDNAVAKSTTTNCVKGMRPIYSESEAKAETTDRTGAPKGAYLVSRRVSVRRRGSRLVWRLPPGARANSFYNECKIANGLIERKLVTEADFTLQKHHLGFSNEHAAPWAAHRCTALRKRVSEDSIGLRPSPGFQAQSTNGVCICSTICATERCPFCCGSFSNSHSWRSFRPSQIIGIPGGGKPQSGAPGGV